MALPEALEADLAWRESELASLKIYLLGADAGSNAHRGLLRALWAMLYAHYEGFTKFCWESLLDEIQAAGVKGSELTEPFALLAMEKEIREVRGSSSSMSVWDFTTAWLPVALQKSAEFPENHRLVTDSNLWPHVFERENYRVGICCNQLELHRSRIKTLVARRNEIAHGKGMVIKDLAEYQEYESATLCLMHELALAVLKTIEKKQYLSTA